MSTLSVSGPFGCVTTSTAVPAVNASTCGTPVFRVVKSYGEVTLTPQVVSTATGSTTVHVAAFASHNPEG